MLANWVIDFEKEVTQLPIDDVADLYLPRTKSLTALTNRLYQLKQARREVESQIKLSELKFDEAAKQIRLQRVPALNRAELVRGLKANFELIAAATLRLSAAIVEAGGLALDSMDNGECLLRHRY